MEITMIIKKDQIETPALLIDLDALEFNIKLMADHFKGKKAKLRPHFKTHKSSTIALMQIEAGAKGICCAKLGEAEVLAAAGIHDILIANQVVDTSKVYRLAALAGNTKMTVCVDNSENITELSQAAEAYGSTIYIYIELEVGMNRCGVDTKEKALELAKQINNSKGLVFEGIQAYTGQLCHKVDESVRIDGTIEAEAFVLGVKNYLEENGIPVKEISGAGTGTYNITGNHDIWTEIQAGSYVFMDTEYGRLGLEFKNSLTILTTVINKRPGAAVTDAGKKVCCQGEGLPAIKGYPDLSAKLNEEHGKIQDEKDALKYLQKLEYIPSHCCTTVNLHDNYYCTRKDLLEMIWPVSARGMSK